MIEVELNLFQVSRNLVGACLGTCSPWPVLWHWLSSLQVCFNQEGGCPVKQVRVSPKNPLQYSISGLPWSQENAINTVLHFQQFFFVYLARNGVFGIGSVIPKEDEWIAQWGGALHWGLAQHFMLEFLIFLRNSTGIFSFLLIYFLSF